MTDSHIHDEDELLYDWEPDDEQPLPKRPRRRLVTPVSAALAGALVAALGFIGGVEVQKGQDDGSGAGNGAALASAGAGTGAGARGGFGRGGGQFGAGGAGGGGSASSQSAPTVGSVANKKGSILYVKDSDGNLVKVKTTSHSKVDRTASSSAGAIHPGDTVIVQGTTSRNGTVTATQIQATASGATAGLGGLFGRFGGSGGGPPQGAAAPQGAPGGG